MDVSNQIHDFLAISHRLIINQVSFASIHVLEDWFSQKKVIENLDIIFHKTSKQKRICKDLKIIIHFRFLFELENRDSPKLNLQNLVHVLQWNEIDCFLEFISLLVQNNFENDPFLKKSIRYPLWFTYFSYIAWSNLTVMRVSACSVCQSNSRPAGISKTNVFGPKTV